MSSKTVSSTFRLREYHMPDGTIQEVFGDAPAPEGGVLSADDTIVQSTTRTPNLPPAPPVAAVKS